MKLAWIVCAGALLIDCSDCAAEDVLRNADAALHAAKSSGPGSLRAFAGDLHNVLIAGKR